MILLLILEYDAVHLHINERRKRQLPADISSILVKEIKNIYALKSVRNCNNTIGSYMCACDPGYSGDGFNCTGIHLIS